MADQMRQPRVSIAMATYNGARFIAEQLESILAQKVRPDEIVISDDGSTDGTPEIARQILSESGIDFRVLSNTGAQGYPTNFSTALEATSGEIVFLSDQDDVWLPEKIELILAEFAASDAELIVHDAHVFWQDSGRRGSLISSELASRGIDPHDNLYGCMMAVRRSFLDLLLPFTSIAVGHDNVINFIARARGSRRYLGVPLIIYRRHSANVTTSLFRIPTSVRGGRSWFSGVFNYFWLRRRIQQFTVYVAILDRQREKGAPAVTIAELERIRGQLAAAELRAYCVLDGGPLSPLMHFASYRVSGIPIKAWMKDAVAAAFRLSRCDAP